MRYRFGELEADGSRLELRRAGTLVALEPKPLRLLLDLLSHAPELRTREELLAAVWPGETVTPASLTRAMNALRRGLAEPVRGDDVVETARGRGYRIRLPVERLEAPVGPADWRELFVGRGALIEGLEARLAAAEHGRGAVVLLEGEPGIGKTRAAEILAERARARGADVRWGRCTEGAGAPPYLPWFQVLRDHLEENPRLERLLVERPALGRYLAVLLPELCERIPSLGEPPRLPPEELRFSVFDAVTEFVGRASRVRPLLVILDDLHWADEPSLRLLAFLAQRIGSFRTLVVGTRRVRDARANPALDAVLAELASRPHVEPALALGGLGQNEVHCILEAALRCSVDRELASEVHARSDGIPFFVQEFARDLIGEGEARGSLGIPATLRRVVAGRVESLDATLRPIAEAAAVIGREAPVGLVARAARVPKRAVLAALPALQEAGLLDPSSGDPLRLRFVHALVQEALYEALPLVRRIELHGAVGAALEAATQGSLAPPLSELAHHFAEAAPLRGAEPALRYLEAAAREAIRRVGGEEAIRLLERALSLVELEEGDTRPRRCQLLVALAEAHDAVGARGRARRRFAEVSALARQLGDVELLAQAALGFSRHLPGFAPMGVHEADAIAMLQEAREALRGRNEPVELRVLAALVPKLYWDPDRGVERAAELSLEAVRRARQSGCPALQALCVARRHLVIWPPAGLEERLALAQEAISLVDPKGDPMLALEARYLRVVDLLELGEPRRAAEDIVYYERLATELRRSHLIAHAGYWQNAMALAEGRLDDLERGIARCQTLNASGGSPTARPSLAVQAALLAWARGGPGPVDPRLVSLAEGLPALPSLSALVAWLASETGERETALAALERATANVADAVNRFDGLLVAAGCAMAVARLGAVARAEQIYDALRPFAGRHVQAFTGLALLGSASRYLGLLSAALGRFDEAELHLEEARAANWRTDARLFTGAALCDHVEVLLRRDAAGDRASARRRLDEAEILATELGAGVLQTRTAELRAKLERGAALRALPRLG